MTSLGITIGVLAVVMLVALGLGLKNYISQQFENLGANIFVILPGEGIGGGGGGFSAFASQTRFDQRDITSLKRIHNADYVVPAFISNMPVESDKETDNGSLIGVSEDYIPLFALKLIAGKEFTKSEVISGAKVGVLAETLANKLFDKPEDAVGKTVKVRNLRIKILGVVGKIGNPERDNALIIPYTTTYGSINPKKDLFAIYVGVKDKDKLAAARKDAERIMLQRYQNDEFSTFEPSDILASVGQIFNAINAVLVAIGSISLVVGGIGIMNIMYANVTERTKQIGIMRAVGAKKSDILIQFMAESTILSVLGGAAGLTIAWILVQIMRFFFPAELNLLAVVLAIGVSSIIGIFFGVFPARRAANLTPIDAIRG